MSILYFYFSWGWVKKLLQQVQSIQVLDQFVEPGRVRKRNAIMLQDREQP